MNLLSYSLTFQEFLLLVKALVHRTYLDVSKMNLMKSSFYNLLLLGLGFSFLMVSSLGSLLYSIAPTIPGISGYLLFGLLLNLGCLVP